MVNASVQTEIDYGMDLHDHLNRQMYKIKTTKYQISSTFKFTFMFMEFC